MTETVVKPRAEQIRRLLADLIAFDTVSDRTNLPLIAYIENYLAPFGITGRRIPDDTGQKASLWVTIGPADRSSDKPTYGVSEFIVNPLIPTASRTTQNARLATIPESMLPL